MNKKYFEFLLQQGEGIKLEFKESFDAKSLSKEIVAFANSEGGKILIGVNDNGVVKGINITNRIKSEIQDLARNCDPPVSIFIDEYKNVLIINVEEGKNKPYRCSAGFFIRQGSNSQKLTTNEIREFFNKEGKILFDETVNNSFTFKKGFYKNNFEKFLERANISKVIPDKDILQNLGVLTENGKFKNAGVLFFCKDISTIFPHAIITCVLYKGIDKTFILDRKDFTGDIISNYENTINFITRNLRLSYTIDSAGPRKEFLEIPIEALREAVVNSIAHRDYNEKGANIQVDIFDDRIEISNPGGLISVLKEKDFGKRSITRNPLLFGLLKMVGLVEKIGSGISRMKNSMLSYGLPEPTFQFTNFFTVTFKRPSTFNANQFKPKNQIANTEKIRNKYGINTEKVYLEIFHNPYIKTYEIAEKTNLSQRTVEKIISNLKREKLLARKGSNKSGYWEV